MTRDVKGVEEKRLNQEVGARKNKEGAAGTLQQDSQEILEQQYESKMSKVSGATDFTILSDFSEVNKAQDKLKKQFVAYELMKFQRSKFSNYHESETLIDRIQHKSAILKALYCKKFQRYILCE